LSEERKSTQSDSSPIFESPFAYVTNDGDIILKETSLFKERKITSVDPESAETQVEALENAFENVKAKADNFFEELRETSDLSEEKARKSFEELKQEIIESETVGDFESLINDSQERLEKLLEKASSDDDEEPKAAEESEGDATDTDAADETETDTEAVENKVAEEGDSDAEDVSEAEAYYKELAEKAEQLVGVSDWAYVSLEFENIESKWSEGPETEEDVDLSAYRETIDSNREAFEEKKQAHYEEKKRQREENLKKKEEILDKMKQIVDEKQWTATREVGKLKGQWDRIKSVPAEHEEDLEKKFKKLLSTFDDHKVDRLVKKKQKEADNLTGKLVILEKMEAFIKELDEDSDWKEKDKEFEMLAKQYRKIGRVPVEKNQEVWSQYHSLQDEFHSMRFKHDKKYRNKIEKYLKRKRKLIDEAEALIDADDLADAARQVNKLHRRWKKAGNLPQKDENELWDRFKAATDAFNEKKSDNIDLLREQEQENLDEKHNLIKKAEELKDSTDWEQTHRDLQKLMDQWKKIGPVPRKNSGKIWKKFKGAMDHFYDRRRDHFKEVKEERKDNLKEKEEVLDKLRELKDHDDPIEAVNQAKPLQEEFKKAGYVPIKHKNRMWKEYREVCDVIYDRFRAAKAAVDVVGRENVESFSADDIADIRKLNQKASNLRKEIKRMEQDLIQQKESLSYFKPSGGSNPLLDQVKEKVEKAEDDISKKEDELAELEKEIDLIKKEGA
jgi:DNA repair exonuclease SbcCD ATPase subunit